MPRSYIGSIHGLFFFFVGNGWGFFLLSLLSQLKLCKLCTLPFTKWAATAVYRKAIKRPPAPILFIRDEGAKSRPALFTEICIPLFFSRFIKRENETFF